MISNLSYKTSFKVGQTTDQNFKVVNFLSPEKFEKCQKNELKHENLNIFLVWMMLKNLLERI